MTKELVVYCDESTSKGEYYSNFYGGAVIRAEHIDEIRSALDSRKTELNLHGEIKWQKITHNYLGKYIDLMDLFFDFVADDKIKVRIMFTQNAIQPINLTDEHRENGYFILYYHFLKHAFGFRYAGNHENQTRLRILLDQLPDTREKADRFKAYVGAITKNPQFRSANIVFGNEDIADISSHDHVILQCLDVVLGSMQFRLNNLHLAKPDGKKRRGKRTIAKEILYKAMNARIRRIYPHFNIGISTGTAGDIENRWKHPYRHWLFIPSENEYLPEKTKQKK